MNGVKHYMLLSHESCFFVIIGEVMESLREKLGQTSIAAEPKKGGPMKVKRSYG